MLAAFKGFNFVARQFQSTPDARERESVGFAANLGEQSANDRKCQREQKLKMGSTAWFGADTDGAPDLFDHRLHDIEADATARNFCDLLPHRETGQEEE